MLVWVENIVRQTNGNVLILTPLAVAPQTVREGEKFGIQVKRTRNGEVHKGINVTNYHRIEKYDPAKFAGVVCDESGCIKHEDSKTKKAVVKFLSKIQYRLLCTATPAPNDFMELGTSSDALGQMNRNQMLGMFFKNDGETTQQWSLKGHAKKKFWQWVGTWARAVRKPSDLGFDDKQFILPPLTVKTHAVGGIESNNGSFFKFADTLNDQRKERKRLLKQRCEKVAEVLPADRPCIAWCQLNDEGDLLTDLLPGAVQVKGSDSDEEKEERLNSFALGQIRALVTKSSIAGWGLNLQRCADIAYFPTWSFESYYQAIRRCWRFGQTNPVTCHLVHSQAENPVLLGMLRKERQSDELFNGICREMNHVRVTDNQRAENGDCDLVLPGWIKGV